VKFKYDEEASDCFIVFCSGHVTIMLCMGRVIKVYVFAFHRVAVAQVNNDNN